MARPRKEIDTSTYEGRFAARLKMLREKAGLSQEEVAKALEVSETAVYHWESGRMIPALQKFPKFAELYKLKKIKDLFPNE